MLFLSTSRVYPVAPLVEALYDIADTRFELRDMQKVPGLSSHGVSEQFPLAGIRSLYGATKYAAEVMLEEYRDLFSLDIIINRCGVIAGPWQFGKVDQGIAAFWTASHMNGRNLKYIGFGGSGRQVRDFLHINDLVKLVLIQLEQPELFRKDVFNVGGGRKNSVSLLELTGICRDVTGREVEILPDSQTRYADIPVYISDTGKIKGVSGWQPETGVAHIIEDIYSWLSENPDIARTFL